MCQFGLFGKKYGGHRKKKTLMPNDYNESIELVLRQL